MAKKKIEKYTEEQVGTPPVALLPARNYKYRVINKEFKINIPRKGKYVDIDDEFFTEEDGEFMLMDNKSNVMYTPALSKVLFATKQYPDLESNQIFLPIALIFKKDEVEIIGQVAEMLQ